MSRTTFIIATAACWLWSTRRTGSSRVRERGVAPVPGEPGEFRDTPERAELAHFVAA